MFPNKYARVGTAVPCLLQMMAMYLVGALLSNEKIKSKMGNKMNEGMLMPYKKVLDNINKNK